MQRTPDEACLSHLSQRFISTRYFDADRENRLRHLKPQKPDLATVMLGKMLSRLPLLQECMNCEELVGNNETYPVEVEAAC